MAIGAIWGAGGAFVYQCVALISQTALTYLLSKSEFGSYGKVFSVLTLAMLLQQIGFNEILLRRGDRLKFWRTQVFWLALLLGGMGTLVIAALAYPLAHIYHDDSLAPLLLLASPSPLIRSLYVLPVLEIIRAMRFRVHYGVILLNGIATSIVTLGLAYFGLGPKSFVVSTLIVEPFAVYAVWRFAHSRVTGGPRPSRWGALLRNLKYVFGSNAARWIRSSVDPLILGLFASANDVGVYFYAQGLVFQISRLITLNLGTVLLPALNTLLHDPPRQSAAFMRTARVIMLIGAPLCVGVAAVATLFVRGFLSLRKWQDLPPVLGALAVGVAFRLLEEPAQTLMSAQGRFRLSFHLSVVTGTLYLCTCFIGALSGHALTTAVAVACFYLICGPALVVMAIQVSRRHVWETLQLFAVPLILAIIAIAPWSFLDYLLPGEGRGRDLIVLAIVVIGSLLSYLVLGRLIRPPGWTDLTERLHELVPQPLKSVVAVFVGAHATQT